MRGTVGDWGWGQCAMQLQKEQNTGGVGDGMKLRALGEEGIGNKGMGMADVLGVGVSSRGKCGRFPYPILTIW